MSVVILAATAGALGSAAQAQDAAAEGSAVTFEANDTIDYLRNVRGGVRGGDTTLNKLLVTATLDGDRLGWRGLTLHAQVFRTNGESFSASRLGDIQTASNIEALHVTRLFEAWAEQQFGKDAQGGLAVRAGLMDLNATFDSIGAAGLFLNSSHGVGPDLSQSGPNGPSIFPASAPGVQVAWTPNSRLVLDLAAFDGQAGDPARPHDFLSARLRRGDGALLIAQLDYRFDADSHAALGAWSYTAKVPSYADPALRGRAHPGIYGFVEAAVPRLGGARGWLRLGVADGDLQAVSGYGGAGLVWTGKAYGRPSDRFGVAVAHAVIGREARRRLDLPRAETTWEATYSFVVNGVLTLQPDLQYVVHPSLQPHTRNALALGLRVIATLPGTGER